MSEARRKIAGMFPNPWKRLAQDYPRVDVVRSDLGERWEVTRWELDGPRIHLHHDLTQVQGRGALTHALEHLDRGAPCDELRSIIEQRVIAATARWLIPDIQRLADAVAGYGDLHRVAHELWVPPHILCDRLDGLTDYERIYINKAREGIA